MSLRGGRDQRASVLLGFLYAFGKGVPKDRAKAVELFGGRAGGGFANRGATESSYAYLLDYDRLPERIEDVTPEYLVRTEQDLKDRHVMNAADINAMISILKWMADLAAEEKAHPSRSTGVLGNPSFGQCARLSSGGHGGLAGMSGCGSSFW
jgi:hypothetical protein